MAVLSYPADEAFVPIPSDAPSDMEAMQLELLRRKTPAERLMIAVRLTTAVVRASKRAIARAHPELTPRELSHLFIELHYGCELADAVRLRDRERDDAGSA